VAAPKAAGPRAFTAPLKPVAFSTAESREDEAKVGAAANGQDSINLTSSIVAEALERGASDIHVEPERRGITVRFRVDGRMVIRDGSIPINLLAPLISRFKVLAQMDITEKRLPQDGRISLEYQGKPFDLRCATINTKHGEKLVMRVLDASKLDQDLGSLIVSDKVSSVIRKLFYRPNGLVLVTGPTGSGKTTTLYAALRERMNKENSICTVEDPIEYDLPGVTQVQVNENVKLGFAEVMRTFMRQDPDIILLGETRDATTAKLACNAALTGHLVLSSYHTNDAISAVLRLRSMGVEPYLVGSALLGVINQRLVRRICPACRVEAPAGEMVIKNLVSSGVPLDPTAKFYKGQGCDKCNKEGFKGRVGVYELLLISNKVRDAISLENCTAQDIREAAMDGSYVPMSRFSAHLLTQGYTVPSEVIRILPKEERTA
jgi:type IV pilus assembly protein PilB